MGKVLKINDEYYVEFFGNGLRYRKKAGTDEAQAQAMLDSIEEQMKTTSIGEEVKSVSLDGFFNQFIINIEPIQTKATIHRYKETIDHFSQFIKDECSDITLLREITPKIIEEYAYFLGHHSMVAKRKTTDRHVNLAIFLMRDIFDQGINFGHINDNPTNHFRFLDIPDYGKLKVVRDDEFIDLSRSLNDTQRLVCYLSLKTGLRIAEIAELKWEELNLESYRITISREIPIEPALIPMIQSLYKPDQKLVVLDDNGNQIKPREFINGLSPILKRYVLPLACFRDTFAQSVINRGVTFSRLNYYLGISDVAKMTRYINWLLKYESRNSP